MNKYLINHFLEKNKSENEVIKNLFLDEKNIFDEKIKKIIKELKITNNISNQNIWRHQNVLSKCLKDKNKDLLELNSEINKLTEKNKILVYNNIIKIIQNKNELSLEHKIDYIIENLFEKCILQNIFSSLYICFLSKLIKEKQYNINTIVFKKTKNIITNLNNLILNIENIESYDLDKNKFSLLIKNDIDYNKHFQSIGNIYSLLYMYDMIETDIFIELIFKYINIINDFIQWDPFCKKKIEKIINVLIGLIENGYFKLIKNINNDLKYDLKSKIETLIKTKKISIRIKFNLQNIYENLESGTHKVNKIIF